MSKAGRNDPCPCGSGKKYKKCCMLKDEAAAASAGAGADVAIAAEEALEGYAMSPSEQKRWLDKNELRAHARVFELGEEEILAQDQEKTSDYVRWAVAQRVRDLGDRECFEGMRAAIATSGRRESAVSYVDLLESHIHEVLRPRGMRDAALRACDQLIAASDEKRKERSQALKAAVLIETGDTAGGEALFATLARSRGALLHWDDRAQALMHAGVLDRARDVVKEALAHAEASPLVRAHFTHLQNEVALAAKRASASPGSLDHALVQIEHAEQSALRDGGAGSQRGAQAAAAAAVLEAARGCIDADTATVADGLGRRALDLFRHSHPSTGRTTLVRSEQAGALTCRSAADQLIRWLLGSRHQNDFLELMTEGLGEVVGPSQVKSSEVMETFASWVACDSKLPAGGDTITAFRKARGSLAPTIEAALDAMEASHFDLYDVVAVNGESARLRRHGEAATSEVPLAGLPLDSGLGHVLLGRVVELDGGPVLLQAVRIPGAAVEEFAGDLEQVLASEREKHAGLSRARLLKLAGAQLVQALYRHQKAWEKEGLVFPRTPGPVRERLLHAHANFRVGDGARAARLIAEQPRFQKTADDTYVWFEHPLEAFSPAGPEPLAAITLRGDELALEALTRSHLERARTRLMDAIGSSLHEQDARLTHVMS
jgi:hypothetical protein